MSLIFDDLQNQMKQIISVPSGSIKQGSDTRVVPDIDSRNAINAFEGLRVLVLDASDDATVDAGAANYIYDGSDWVKISEVESLDINVYTQSEVDAKIAALTIADFGYDAGLKLFSSAAPALGATDAVHAAISLPETGTTEVVDNISNPDVPRILTVTGNQSGPIADIVIVGTNADDEEITETITMDNANTVSGTKAFKTVTSITVGAQAGSGDTVTVGTGAALGIGQVVTVGLPVYASVDGNKETTDPTITTSTTMEENLIEFNSSLSGVPVLCYFID